MNHRERFHAIMNYQPHDRMPVYFFGTWRETRERWEAEGLRDGCGGSGAFDESRALGMDPNWEYDAAGSFWNNQGLMNKEPIVPGGKAVVEEETDEYRIVRSALGGLTKQNKKNSSIPQHLEPDLKPTRADWERFKSYLDPHDPERRLPGHKERIAVLGRRDRVACCYGGSLFGVLRDWLGVEQVSFLPYDDPELYRDMIAFMADFYVELNAGFLNLVEFDFAYFWEDCCFNTGPLISPAIYREFYHQHYQRMIRAYRDMGVPWMLMDSDGKIDDLLGCWLDSGFDIIFPIEVGTWKASPTAMRKQYGKRLRMLGGVDKHVISKGEAAIRMELESLLPLVRQGGYIPIPDHRIPPDCSLAQFRTYLRVFREVFGG